jgi:hypothetical protein
MYFISEVNGVMLKCRSFRVGKVRGEDSEYPSELACYAEREQNCRYQYYCLSSSFMMPYCNREQWLKVEPRIPAAMIGHVMTYAGQLNGTLVTTLIWFPARFRH